jgi:hypothetical protein
LILKKIKSLIFGGCGKTLRKIKSSAVERFLCPQSCPQGLSPQGSSLAQRYFGIFDTVFPDRNGP